MKGFKDRLNKNNGFYVAELHYSADPNKCTTEWETEARRGMDAKSWLSEFCLSWETFSGHPVFGKEYKDTIHTLGQRYEPDPYLPILRGWDFGGNHTVVTGQIKNGRLYLIDEFANLGYNTRRIGQEIISSCAYLYKDHKLYIDYVDPSGLWDNSKAAEGRACAQILREVYGLKVIPGIQSVGIRIDSVMRLLTTLKDGIPLLQVNPELPLTIQAFKGAYAYPEDIKGNQKANKPEKTHPYSDLMDCIQYIATKMKFNTNEPTGNEDPFFDDDGSIYF